jgi:predicted GTPase
VSRAITGIDQREGLLLWAEQLAAAVEPRDQAASRAIRQTSAAHAENRFVLTVLGKAKRGKSTFVNALLGRADDQLAPIDKLPASNVLTRFAFADTLTAKAFFRPSTAGGAASQQVISPQHVREYVTEELNPANSKNVECVEVIGPFPGFDRDLVLIDTPGAGSIHEYHDDIIRAVIPQSDAVVFLVTAQMPLDQDELELLRQLREADVQKIIFSINRVDQVPPAELEQAEAHNRGLLQQVGLAVDRIHRISAKRAFEGDLVGSGLESLLDEVRQLLRDGKAKILAERTVSRIKAAVAPVLSGMDAELSLLSQSADERRDVRAGLERRKAALPEERSRAERRFESSWQHAVERMAVSVKNERGPVEQRLLSVIDSAPLTSVGKLAKDLPARIISEIEAAAQPHAAAMEAALQEACRELDASYPSVSLEALNVGGVMRTNNPTTTKGVITGTATAAIGGLAVGAAQTAAAAAFQVVTSQSLVGAALSALVGVEIPILTSTVVPTALPIWAVLAGPVGWTLMGVGALTIPVGWAMGRSKMKEQLRDQTQQQIDRVFKFLTEDRLPLIRNSGPAILEEYRQRIDREVAELENALARASAATATPESQQQLATLRDRIVAALEAKADLR